MLLFLGYAFVRSCLGGSCRCSSGLFTLATTDFTRVVRCTTIAWGADRRGGNHDLNHFSCHNSLDWSRLCGNDRFNHGFDGDDCRCGRFFDSHALCGGFSNGRLCNGLAYNAGFAGRLWCLLDHRSLDHGCLHLGFDYRLGCCCNWFGSGLNFRLCLLSRSDFNFRCLDRFDRCHGFHDRGFNNRRFNNRCRSSGRFNNRHGFGLLSNYGFSRSRFLGCRGRPFGLLIGLGFSRGADYSAGNGFCHGQTGRQFSCGGWRVFSFGFFAAFFRTFDHIAVGITLALATIAATTLTA